MVSVIGWVMMILIKNIVLSVDDGRTWNVLLNQPTTFSVGDVYIAMKLGVWVVIQYGETSVHKSTDNGVTWTSINLGIGNIWVDRFAVDNSSNWVLLGMSEDDFEYYSVSTANDFDIQLIPSLQHPIRN